MNPRIILFTTVNNVSISNTIMLEGDDISIIIHALRKTEHSKAVYLAANLEKGVMEFYKMVQEVSLKDNWKEES